MVYCSLNINVDNCKALGKKCETCAEIGFKLEKCPKNITDFEFHCVEPITEQFISEEYDNCMRDAIPEERVESLDFQTICCLNQRIKSCYNASKHCHNRLQFFAIGRELNWVNENRIKYQEFSYICKESKYYNTNNCSFPFAKASTISYEFIPLFVIFIGLMFLK